MPVSRDVGAWGPLPTESEWRDVEKVEARLQEEQARALAARSLPISKLSARSGLSRSQVEQLIREKELVAFRYSGRTLVPAWQISPTTKALLPCLGEVARAFGADAVAVTDWAVSPNPHLGRRTPRAALAAGDIGGVRRALEAFGSAAF